MDTPLMPRSLDHGPGAILAVDFGHQFLNEEILVTVVAVLGIDVESPPSGRQDHNEIPDRALLREGFPNLLTAPVQPTALVFEKPVQEVKGRIPLVG